MRYVINNITKMTERVGLGGKREYTTTEAFFLTAKQFASTDEATRFYYSMPGSPAKVQMLHPDDNIYKQITGNDVTVSHEKYTVDVSSDSGFIYLTYVSQQNEFVIWGRSTLTRDYL